MRINKFIIENFKGIEFAEIDFVPSGAGIYTLIGLNESGKTTVLEALSTFNIKKDETGALYGANISDVKPASYVPKSLKANFTGKITVQAKVVLDTKDKEQLAAHIFKTSGIVINAAVISHEIEITRGYKFENSDYKSKIYTFSSLNLLGASKGKKKPVSINSPDPIWEAATDYIADKVPEIIYFPTFIFNQPEKIILNPVEDEKPINKLYRQIINNIASSLNRPLDVQKHIVDRLLGEESVADKVVSFFTLAPDKQQQIEAVLNEMSSHVTHTVFTSWTKIFGGDFSGREIVLKPGIQNINNKPEVYLQFAIKDRKSTYDITERSLGFRWFFSFLLFTFYRALGKEKSTIFLLDEPASNLHARAQMQLLDNLSKIAVNGSQIIYSTHSHYLINPEWLDQAYIISNKAIDYDNIDGRNESATGGQTLISAEKYRRFVGNNPDKMTYFQPVLDTLDVVPSKLELLKKSVLVSVSK